MEIPRKKGCFYAGEYKPCTHNGTLSASLIWEEGAKLFFICNQDEAESGLKSFRYEIRCYFQAIYRWFEIICLTVSSLNKINEFFWWILIVSTFCFTNFHIRLLFQTDKTKYFSCSQVEDIIYLPTLIYIRSKKLKSIHFGWQCISVAILQIIVCQNFWLTKRMNRNHFVKGSHGKELSMAIDFSLSLSLSQSLPHRIKWVNIDSIYTINNTKHPKLHQNLEKKQTVTSTAAINNDTEKNTLFALLFVCLSVHLNDEIISKDDWKQAEESA